MSQIDIGSMLDQHRRMLGQLQGGQIIQNYFPDSMFQNVLDNAFGSNMYNDGPKLQDAYRQARQLTIKPKMNINGKEYLIVNANGVQSTAKDMVEAEKKASEIAHSSQGSVYIFRPCSEVAPKRDVVVTTITLG